TVNGRIACPAEGTAAARGAPGSGAVAAMAAPGAPSRTAPADSATPEWARKSRRLSDEEEAVLEVMGHLVGRLVGPVRRNGGWSSSPATAGSSPDRSRTMYSAYHAGQFSSRLPPLRFSYSPCADSAPRSAAASSAGEVKVVSLPLTRPGNRAVTSCS